MTTFTVVQVRRDRDLEWTVERSPHGTAFDLQGYYLSKGAADAEAKQLRALERTREIGNRHLGAVDANAHQADARPRSDAIYFNAHGGH
jgi:hypothetical protein